MTSSITKFHNQYEFLAPRYRIKIPYEGIEYPSLYHAFEASKTDNDNIRKQIAAAPLGMLKEASPITSTKWGWHGPTILKDLLFLKFGVTSIGDADERMILQKKLVGTGFARLIWGNTEHDNYYGYCNCKKEPCLSSTPKNVLGYALEATRKIIRERLESLNNIYQKCECGKDATKRILWSSWWIPKLTPSCEGCLMKTLKVCMDAGDGYLTFYPLTEADSVLDSVVPNSVAVATVKPEAPKTTTYHHGMHQSWGEWDDCCGTYMYHSNTTTIERKWHSMTWKSEE